MTQIICDYGLSSQKVKLVINDEFKVYFNKQINEKMWEDIWKYSCVGYNDEVNNLLGTLFLEQKFSYCSRLF